MSFIVKPFFNRHAKEKIMTNRKLFQSLMAGKMVELAVWVLLYISIYQGFEKPVFFSVYTASLIACLFSRAISSEEIKAVAYDSQKVVGLSVTLAVVMAIIVISSTINTLVIEYIGLVGCIVFMTAMSLVSARIDFLLISNYRKQHTTPAC